MKRTWEVLSLLAFICLTPFLMAALSVEIVTPADGNGPTWNCTKIDGTTMGERDGGSSSVTGALWKKVGGIWKRNSPLGAIEVASTSVPVGSTNGTWNRKYIYCGRGV